MPDFIVESQGHCFLCLNKITTGLNPNHITLCNPPSQVYSLHSLSRYLKLDMGIVFHERRDNDNIPDHLLFKVRKSKLKAELCQGCADLNQRLSLLHHQLEKIEMEMISNLNMIHQRIVEAGEEAGLIQKLASISESTDGLTEKVKIADALRKETIQKSSLRLNRVQPKVKVMKMTTEEIKLAEKRTRDSINRRSDLELRRIKMEPTIPDTEDDYSVESSHGDDDDSYFQSTHFTTDEDGQVEAKFNVPMETSASSDRRSVVRRVRYKSKQSNRPAPRNTISCRVCKKKIITNNYSGHLAVHLGKSFPCLYCQRPFCQSGHRNLHMRTKCPKRKMFKMEVNTGQ